MTRAEALAALRSRSAHERLRAARLLVRECEEADLKALNRALRREPVSYVRAALELAIARLLSSRWEDPAEPADEFQIPRDTRTQIERVAVERVTGQLLHEISPLVGLISDSAMRELPVYEGSETEKHVGSLSEVLDAIEQLQVAAALPRPTELDLAGWLDDLVFEVAGTAVANVSLQGARPTMINSDPALLRLAVSNGLRNALEAVSYAGNEDAHSVVVTWGATNLDYWVAVLDRGPGLVGPVESAFGVGQSTKKGHSGFGLAIAKQAIETLGGTCTLEATDGGGARFELRWAG